MKQLSFIMLFSFSLLLAESLSLEKCFRWAEENHPVMKQKIPINDIADIDLKNLNTKWLPQTNLNMSATYQSDVTSIDLDLPPTMPGSFDIPTPDKDMYKADFEISQLIFDGGLISVRKELTQQDKKISLQKLATSFQQIKISIANVFYNIAILGKQAKILDCWLRDLEKSRETLRDLVQNGIMEKSEIYEIDIKIEEINQQIAENKIYKRNHQKILSELTGHTIDDNIHLYVPEKPITENDFKNAQSILFDYQLERLDIARKISFRSRLPKIVGFAKAGYGKPGMNMLNDEFDDYYMGGISLQWHVWDWKFSKREREKLKLNRKLIQYSEEAYNQKTRIELEKYKSAIENLHCKISRDQKIFNLQEKLKNSAAAKFNNGVMNTNDFLKYSNNFVRAQITMELHKIQLYKEKVNYLILKGEL